MGFGALIWETLIKYRNTKHNGFEMISVIDMPLLRFAFGAVGRL
jgi:hypothetical protein